MNKEMNKELIGSLAWAGGMIALALGATFAQQAGLYRRRHGHTGGHRHERALDRLLRQPDAQGRGPETPAPARPRGSRAGSWC